MKLLFDHNLSPKLIALLQDCFAETTHVNTVGLAQADDVIIWEYAENNGFAVVTKDADFGELGMVRGFPPKVIWIRLGNCSTLDVAALLRKHEVHIRQFGTNPTAGLLALS